MSQDDVQKRLDQSSSGTPLVKPDEQHKYMGTFRERCYLTLTVGQMPSKHNQQALAKEISKHPDATLLLNGTIGESLQQEYMHLANEKQVHFTFINNYIDDQKDSFGAILTAKEAVNEEVVDVAEKYPLPNPAPEEKESFWKKLF